MVPRPAAVTDTVLPSLPTRLMPTIGTLADPAVKRSTRNTRAPKVQRAVKMMIGAGRREYLTKEAAAPVAK